ncbi:MAG TPA: biotin/lipoyl-containing protein, partial [Burkholderiales bacterium]|nr:biotin/lipoyl-containing protein [Burkholderiales bacterium]
MSETIEVKVPDIGDFKDVPVIEIFVKPGDSVKAEESLITVESDKSTMEVPSPVPGVVKELRVKLGDKVSKGSLVVVLDAADAGGGDEKPAAAGGAQEKQPAPSGGQKTEAAASAAEKPKSADAAAEKAPTPAPARSAGTQAAGRASAPSAPVDEAAFGKAHASPSVRRLAREFGVDLSKVQGTGPKARILQEDVQAYVKAELSRPKGAEGGVGLNLAPAPAIDFSKFGPVTTQPLSRIKKLSGAFLHRSWVTIPHVTQQDEADVTDLE